MENQAIYYYLSPEGANVGPLTLTQLKNLHQDGTITDSTYVISTIEKKWITFAELPAPIPADVSASVPKPAQAVAAPAPADPVQPLRKGFTHRLERLIQFNSEVGAWLAKVITFGKFNPENSASFEDALIKMGMLQVYFVWLSTVILCVTIGLIVNPAFAWVGIFIGIFLGFFFQYICYLFTETNIKLLTSVKIPLASMLFPRLMAIASLFLIIPCIIGMFTEPVYIPLFLAVGFTCYLTAWLCLRSNRFFTCIWKKAEAQHEPIAFFRFFIRLFGITAHLSAPILLAGAILTTVISSISLSTATQNNDARNTSPVATSYYNGPSPYGGMRTRNYSPSYMDSLPNTGKTPEAFGLVTILSIVFLCFPVITYFGVCVLSLIPYILDSFKKMPKRKGKEPDYDDDELQESKSCQIR